MRIWFPNEENIYSADIILKIEMIKADIQKMEYEKNKTIENQKMMRAAIDFLQKNKRMLKTCAEVVSMKEYKRSCHQITTLVHGLEESKRKILLLEEEIKYFNDRLKELEIEKKQVEFKLLEFKRNE